MADANEVQALEDELQMLRDWTDRYKQAPRKKRMEPSAMAEFSWAVDRIVEIESKLAEMHGFDPASDHMFSR